MSSPSHTHFRINTYTFTFTHTHTLTSNTRTHTLKSHTHSYTCITHAARNQDSRKRACGNIWSVVQFPFSFLERKFNYEKSFFLQSDPFSKILFRKNFCFSNFYFLNISFFSFGRSFDAGEKERLSSFFFGFEK